METPLPIRFQGLRKKLDRTSAQSGLSKADLVRLAVHVLLQQCKTSKELYLAQAKFKGGAQ